MQLYRVYRVRTSIYSWPTARRRAFPIGSVLEFDIGFLLDWVKGGVTLAGGVNWR